jgi:hypothetical protein
VYGNIFIYLKIDNKSKYKSNSLWDITKTKTIYEYDDFLRLCFQMMILLYFEFILQKCFVNIKI